MGIFVTTSTVLQSFFLRRRQLQSQVAISISNIINTFVWSHLHHHAVIYVLLCKLGGWSNFYGYFILTRSALTLLFYLFIYSAVTFNFVSEFLKSNDPCRMQNVKLAALPSSKTGLKSARGKHAVGVRNALKVSECFFLLLVYAWTGTLAYASAITCDPYRFTLGVTTSTTNRIPGRFTRRTIMNIDLFLFAVQRGNPCHQPYHCT